LTAVILQQFNLYFVSWFLCRARNRECLDSLDVYLWEHFVFRW